MSVNSPELVQFVIFVNADWSVLTLIIQPIIESDQSLSRWFVESSTHINVVSTPNLHKFCVSVVSFILSHEAFVSLQHVRTVVVCLHRVVNFCFLTFLMVIFISLPSFLLSFFHNLPNIVIPLEPIQNQHPVFPYVHALHVCCFNFECFRGMQTWQRRRQWGKPRQRDAHSAIQTLAP